MSVRPLARVSTFAAAGSLVLGLVAALADGGTAATSGGAAERRTPNPTGTNAGSLPNGAGNLKVSLVATSDGRIKVSWKRPGPARNLKRFVVTVGPNRALETRTRLYKVSPKRQSVVVNRAVDAVPASGNYTFVRVAAYRKKGHGHGGSPAKWIQAPITSPCTAAPKDQVVIADFNVRTWAADQQTRDPISKWSVRGPNVVAQILKSGARAISVQEASGGENPAYGGKTQYAWIVDELNAADPDSTANWVDALTPADYKAPPGRTPGLIGTRIFYDSSKFTKLAAGLRRMVVPGWDKDSLTPWARLQATSGTQAPFVLTSNHLRVGTGTREYETRIKQTTLLIDIVKDLRAQFGDTVFAVGDLNSTANDKPLNYPQRELLRAGLYDSYATTNLVGPKYPSTNNLVYPVTPTPLRRDYILTYGPVKGSCGYRNQAYQTKAEEASDHFLQVATLPLPPV